MSLQGHRAKSQKPPIPLISAIVSCHPFNLAEAKSSVRLHPNKPENLHSNGDFDNCGIFSFIHKWWKIVRWKKNSPCSSTSPLRRQKAGTHLRDRYLPCFLNNVVLPTMISRRYELFWFRNAENVLFLYSVIDWYDWLIRCWPDFPCSGHFLQTKRPPRVSERPFLVPRNGLFLNRIRQRIGCFISLLFKHRSSIQQGRYPSKE